MRKIWALLTGLICICGCNNTSSPVSKIYHSSTNGTMNRARAVHQDDSLAENPEENPAVFFGEYVGRYTHPKIIDTLFLLGSDTFQLQLKHYCLLDSAITVPKGYIYMYKLDSFVTHNFETTLRLFKNKKPITERMIFKKDFEKFLTPELQKFAVLYSPSLNLSKGEIDLGYSISIPLTDVGIGLNLILDRDGSVVFRDHS